MTNEVNHFVNNFGFYYCSHTIEEDIMTSLGFFHQGYKSLQKRQKLWSQFEVLKNVLDKSVLMNKRHHDRLQQFQEINQDLAQILHQFEMKTLSKSRDQHATMCPLGDEVDLMRDAHATAGN